MTRIWKVASSSVALLAVVVGFALFGAGPAHAQGAEGEYVDLALILETPVVESLGSRDLTIIVMNLGSRTAYDVEVVVDVVYPANTSFFEIVPDVPIGAASLENGGHSLRWTIPEFLGMQRFEVSHYVRHWFEGGPDFDAQEDPHEFYAEVTTASFESGLRKGNNTDRVWSTLDNAHDVRTRPAQPDYSVNVSVDERNPSPDDIVNFTVTTNHGTFPYSAIDQKVAIDLTDGLMVDVDPNVTPPREISYAPDDRAASVSYSNGVFNLGTLKFSDNKPEHSVTLPIRVSIDAVVNEQCLTATITGNPPPEASPYDDDRSDNVAKLCLGDQPVQPFVSGQVDAFTVFPCVDITDAPCESTDDLRVRAVDSSGQVLVPGTVVFLINPTRSRIYDGHMDGGVLQSVNDGNTVSWQTAVNPDSSFTGVASGVELYYSRTPYEGTTGWAGLTPGIAARDADGNLPPPGKVFVRFDDGYALRRAESPDYQRVPTAPTGNSTTPNKIHYFLEFEKLGTYKFTWYAVAERSSLHGSENCNPDSHNINQIFCGSETYTFHIGPMADLAVEDGGASSRVAANQHAMAIVAVNNGPDDSSGAKVSGLPTGAQVLRITQGTYDSTAGEWNIGELRVPDYYRSRGEPDPTLVLSASAGATADVSIANSENYEVCVGPSDNPGNLAHDNQTDCEAVTNASWNSTPWYDYDTDNSRATITARSGTGGVGEGIPALEPPSVHTPAVGIAWSEVYFVYGVPVKDYQVQWSINGVSGWTQLESELTLLELIDVTILSGVTRYYRVRAVSEAGVQGPWSAPVVARTSGAETVPGAPTGVSATPEGGNSINVSWSAPVDDGGSAITRYEVQWSPDSMGGWRGAGNTADAETFTLTDTGIAFGTKRYYRVAARNSRGLGAWSDPPASATTQAGVPGQPNLAARPADANTILLTWDAPADNGGAIGRYRIEYSTDGSPDGTWHLLARPIPEDTSYEDGGLDPGTRRFYRIRATNTAGDGSWSRTADATTPPAMPGAPTLRARADGEAAISVSWDVPTDTGGADMTGYELQWSADGSDNGYSTLTSTSGSVRSYTHGNLKPGDTRHYQVRARNSAGWGPYSSSSSATTLTGVPTAPGLTARANGATEIKLTWTKPDDRGSEIRRYELEVSDDGNDWNTLAFSVSPDDSEYVDDGLTGGTTKHYRVRAVNLNGAGQWSAVRSARTDAGGPDAPVLTATPNGNNQIDLLWTVPPNNGSVIRGYRVERSVDGNAPWEQLTGSARGTTYSDTTLYRGMKRYYRVAAFNSAGAGPFSDVQSATTTGVPATAPSAPALMRVSNVARGQVTLAWAAPGDDGGAPVSGYQYRYSLRKACAEDPDRVCYSESDLTETRSTSARITGLTDAGLYTFSVWAVNPIGRGELAVAQADLAPSSNAGVLVNPTSFTVDEGESFSYTIRLATEPPHPVWIIPRTREGDEDISADTSVRYLVPDGWTHPDPNKDWSGTAFEWDQGVTVTRTANEDADTEDGGAVVEIHVERLDYYYYKPCDYVPAADKSQCEQDWEDDWKDSPYLRLHGPSVLVVIRDDD